MSDSLARTPGPGPGDLIYLSAVFAVHSRDYMHHYVQKLSKHLPHQFQELANMQCRKNNEAL